MAKVKFSREFLTEELGLPHDEYTDDVKIISNRICGSSRWSIEYELIFEYQGQVYKTYYRVGATEQQDERPWEYEREVECIEVHQVEKLIKVWVPVEEKGDV